MSQPGKGRRGPLWLRAVYRLERAIGEPLESVLHSDTYFDVISETMRVRARTGRTLEAVSRRALHMLNLPAGSDVRRLREQLGRLERDLAQLGKTIDHPERMAEPANSAQRGLR